jgi:hypothetical protein
MEFKWLMICCAIVSVSVAIGTGIDAHYDSQCKVAAIQSNKTLDEIKEICK